MTQYSTEQMLFLIAALHQCAPSLSSATVLAIAGHLFLPTVAKQKDNADDLNKLMKINLKIVV